ncbi:MFS transporter [Chloroflexota bacterium]
MTEQNIVQPSINKPQFFYGYIVVLATLFTMILMFGAYNSFGVFFKPLLTEFGWTRAMTSAAFSLSWIMQGLLAIIIGKLSDRLGPRIVMTICSFFLGLGYLLMSQVGTIWQFCSTE